jgi:hypothetical protein
MQVSFQHQGDVRCSRRTSAAADRLRREIGAILGPDVQRAFGGG